MSAGEHARISPDEMTGPQGLYEKLKSLDLNAIEAEQRAILKTGNMSKRSKALKTLNLIAGMKKQNMSPADLMITKVPVIPPLYRPFSIAGGTFIPGDGNELYADFYKYKNVYDEVKKELGEEGAAEARLAMYDSVKALFGFGDPVNPKTKGRGVSGFLKQITGTSPKFGVVSRRLASKGQDNVGYSAITVDPDLNLDQVSIPETVAWKSYGSFVQRRLVKQGMDPMSAMKAVKERKDSARKMLDLEMQERPGLLTRSPAWHKFNIVGQYPKIHTGDDSIHINPYITTGMNADFDGDTMTFHVPTLAESVKETKEKLLPSKMIFSIRDPEKVMPNMKQEQVLGLFQAQKAPAKKTHAFRSAEDAENAIMKGEVSMADEIQIVGGFDSIKSASRPLTADEKLGMFIIKHAAAKSAKELLELKQCCGRGCINCPYIPQHKEGAMAVDYTKIISEEQEMAMPTDEHNPATPSTLQSSNLTTEL